MTQMSLIKKVQQLREYEEEKDGIRANIIRDRIVGDLPGIRVLECFREGDAELVTKAIEGLQESIDEQDLCPEEYDAEKAVLYRLRKACYLMEGAYVL